MDRGGYQNRQFWKQPFIENGRTLSWDEAMPKFRDSTGRPDHPPGSWAPFPKDRRIFPWLA